MKLHTVVLLMICVTMKVSQLKHQISNLEFYLHAEMRYSQMKCTGILVEVESHLVVPSLISQQNLSAICWCVQILHVTRDIIFSRLLS